MNHDVHRLAVNVRKAFWKLQHEAAEAIKEGHLLFTPLILQKLTPALTPLESQHEQDRLRGLVCLLSPSGQVQVYYFQMGTTVINIHWL